MAKQQIKHKPLTNDQYNYLLGKNPLTDITLFTGVRTMELKRLIDQYVPGINYVDIKTKYSGKHKNRIWLNDKVVDILENNEYIKYMKGKCKKTFQRHIAKVLKPISEELENHNLRATFATRLAMLGVRIETIQTLMNHASIEQTAKYINLSEIKLSTAVDLLSDYETIEGYTLPEALEEIGRQREKLKRQELEINRLKGGKCEK